MADDANKRINLAAPLLSVRRHGGAATGLPSFETDGMPPGGVPFGWEHRPGHPKSVRTRRTPALLTVPDEARAVVEAALLAPEEAERLSDALSRVDSCFTVNCSVTGISDAGAPAGAWDAPGARASVMMDRFLPAAKAVAVGYPKCTSRKAGAAAVNSASTSQMPARTGDSHSLQIRLPVEHSPANDAPSNYAKDRSHDDDWDIHSTRGFASRRCGLLPTRCVKSTLLLLNPAQAMRRSRGGGGGGGAPRCRGRRWRGDIESTNPLVPRSRDVQHLGHDTCTQSWEEVYINSLLRSDRCGPKGRGALTSVLDRTVRELCTDQGEGVHPKASRHLGLLLVLDRIDECHDGYPCSLAHNFPEAGEPALLLPPKSSRPAKANDRKKSRRDAGGYNFPLLLEDKTAASRDIVPLPPRALLPLPPPRSPSESWLSRALPSVSNKPPATSFLGIHVQHKKQAPSPWCSGDRTRVIHLARPRQIQRISDLQK